MTLHTTLAFGLALVSALTTPDARALQITSLSPQGEVARVRQVVVKFDQSAIAFGDPKAPAPLTLSCSDAAAAKGNGRWTSDREWAFQFENDLPPGVTCSLAGVAGFKSPKGAELPVRSYQFNTGGPFVQNIWPGTYERIDEEQIFVLKLNGAATRQSVQDNVWCAPSDVGERVPVTWIEGPNRDALLTARGLDGDAARDPLKILTLGCSRRLTSGIKFSLVYGKGVASASGIANKVERRYDFNVREAFAANFTCQRENAQSACMPLRPMVLAFNAPITRKLAEAIRMSSAKGAIPTKIGGEEDDAATGQPDDLIDSVSFGAILPEQTAFTIELPRDLRDASGRSLRNADSFPLKVATGPMPPLAKFAAAPFGIVERFAESGDGAQALLPVTVRNIEAALAAQGLQPGAGGKVSDLQLRTDRDVIAWYQRVQAFDQSQIDRKTASDHASRVPPVTGDSDRHYVQTRMLSLLAGKPGVKTLDLPQTVGGDPRPFEVVGIPLTPGFHVVEIASQRLGASLLDPKYGADRTMVVRTSALVTNLGVHFKLGRENAMVWVTTLDKGQPVANAKVRVSDCTGAELATGTSDARGLVSFTGLSSEPGECVSEEMPHSSYFVSARAPGAGGVEELAFTWSDWQRGIEPWRFNLPTSTEANATRRGHTVFDRTLLRAGETVSMKHLVRTETGAGFGLPPTLPRLLVITHVGSGQRYTQPLRWRTTPTGGRSAESTFQVPPAAKLGVYEVALRRAPVPGAGAEPVPEADDDSDGDSEDGGYRNTDSIGTTGSFRVEEFRLPVLEGRIAPADAAPLVAATAVPTAVQINYVAGGGAANLPVRVSALLRNRSLSFADHDSFSFSAPSTSAQSVTATAAGGEEESTASQEQRVVADKLPLVLDRNGAGKLSIDALPAGGRPRELVLEATYADPSGEVQTLRNTVPLWPASVVAGIKTEGWVSTSQKIKFQALALDLTGKPQADVALDVRAVARITTSSRKRMVGGFYTYDNRTDTKDLGTVCTGKSDARGLLLCETKIDQAGEIELVATATDKQGRSIRAASSVWVTKQGELWFGGEDHDRIDLLPEKKTYQPGETARFQVRMPFRFATALVSVEREGILETQVVQLNGQDPTVSLKIKDGWGPNVYVSVMALRGRLRDVPWYSFFTWGFKAPREWWTAFWYEGREYIAPTALVDLSKPAYRIGVAEINVGTQAHRLDVKVATDKPSYTVRSTARATITVKRPDGKPAAGAEVALAAVDQALLELMPNSSWNLLEAMLQRRSWGVETSTAQMEIIGRRHYGRKAVPAGGGGGSGATRELLETLLLWKPAIVLDANGQATVDVPLNDALTTFKIVAVADAATGLFGTGSTSIRATQDLQLVSGLPPLVREDDQFRAQVTVRNTTAKPMQVELKPTATLGEGASAAPLPLEPKTVDVPAGESREVLWDVSAPAQTGTGRSDAIVWNLQARDTLGTARDGLKVRQRIVPAVPLTVQQATLVQVDGTYTLDVAPPADAIAGRGGLKLALQPKLAEGMPGVRDWFAAYPFSCLEQKTSKAVGLRDGKMWQAVVAQLPTYLDSDGLASYFPPRAGESNRGSDTLTAYLLASTHEAASLNPAFALSAEAREPMERGLVAFIEGRIQRDFWSPRKDLDVRKLAAIEALSRYGSAQVRMLGSITIAPNQWPTHAVIDWLNILNRIKDVPQRTERLAEATQVLRARLSFQGTKVMFSTEQDDYWWWLMQNGDVNTARLILAVIDDPAWKDDLPRLANGFMARQQKGAWLTTTANLWGGLALEKFSARFEKDPVAGTTRAMLGTAAASVDWSRVERIKASDASGAMHLGSLFGAPAAPGNLRNNTMFLPWATPPAKQSLAVTHQGSGKPWLTLQSLAAVQLKAPFDAGYGISKTITPVEQAVKGRYTRGDVLRITLAVNASSDMTWVAITDPIPAGSTILGGGLGRDSEIATQGEKSSGSGYPAFEERSFEAFRSYYEFLPKGKITMQYTVRLNNVGDFALPPSRVEAMYAPEMFGEAPNAKVKVEAVK